MKTPRWRKVHRGTTQSREELAPDPPNRGVQLFVTRMCVDCGRERTRMPREALGEIEVFRRPVDVRDRRVPEVQPKP